MLHCNLLLPLQGSLRQAEEQVGKDTPDPEEEEEEDSGLSGVLQAPQEELGRGLHLSQPHLHYQVRPLGMMSLVKYQRKLLLPSLCLKDSLH